MKNAIKYIGYGAHKSSASVVDGKLILSFPHAITPVVWQMDLGQAKASALEVREDNGKHSLVLKTPKGETIEIAPFEKRSEAVGGLMAAARALENAHGKIRSEGGEVTAFPAPKKRKGGRWIGIVIGAIVLLILINVWSSQSPRPVNGTGAMNNAAPPVVTGAPMNADDFLMQNK
jgi:hypothetical protein